MVDLRHRGAVDPSTMNTSTNPHGTITARSGPRRRVITVVAALCMFGWCAGAFGGDSISASESAQHVGETATVCGTVASAKYVTTSKGQPTFLNLDKAYPNQLFTAVIWGDDRGRFQSPPEVAFDGKRICVSGVIATFRGKPQIVVRDPKQIGESK